MRHSSPVLVASLSSLVLSAILTDALRAGELPFSLSIVDASLAGAHDIATGDVDADGDLDLVAVGNFADDVRYWENGNGSGTQWTERILEGSFDDARGVALGDIDGDGDLDTIGASYGDDTIAWWEYTNGISWNERIVDTTIDGAREVAGGDIDGDGDLDLAAAGQLEDQIVWWENTAGNGTSWQKRIVDANFGGAHDVVIDDVDSDGDLDLVGAAIDDDAVVWWENVGSQGLSWTPHLVDANLDGARGVAVADVDSDGDRDLLAAARDEDELRWYENLDGDGELWTTRTIDGFFDGAITIVGADLDLDGDIDVAAAAVLADEVTWWENTQGDGTAWTERKIDVGVDGPFALAVGDIDGDGDPDLGAPVFNDGDVVWWENRTIHRSAIFPTEITVNGAIDGAIAVVSGDLDGDGDDDLATAAFVDDEIRWWENLDGQGGAWAGHSVAALGGRMDVAIGDVDGDGDLDLGSTASISDEVAWYENVNGDGSVWLERELTTSYNGAHAIEFADVNRDGDIDIVASAEFEDRVAWWDNLDGVGTSWVMRTINSDLDSARGIDIGDIDGDGDVDVAVAAYDEDNPIWLENINGDGLSWTRLRFDSGFNGPDSIELADLDADGDLDVIMAGELENAVSWWENLNGQGTLWRSESPIAVDFDGATSVTAADLDGDGDLDLAAAADVADAIAWWENDGNGANWIERRPTSNLNAAQDVVAADVNGDGRLDLVSVAELADCLSWFENLGGQALADTADVAPSMIPEGSQAAALSIELLHEGRVADADIEFESVTLLFEESAGDPLTTNEANALIESLDVYLDDGSGTFDPADPFVGGISTLSLSGGLETVAFPDDEDDLNIAFGGSKLYWVGITLTTGASRESPASFQITHLYAETDVEDADNDIPLTMQYRPDTTTKTITAIGAQTLSASGACPGPVTIEVEGAEPGGNVTVIFSQDLGEFVLPFGNCLGTEFGLDDPSLLFTLVADVDGNAQTTGSAPAGACGAFLQAMDVTNCAPTNVAAVPE